MPLWSVLVSGTTLIRGYEIGPVEFYDLESRLFSKLLQTRIERIWLSVSAVPMRVPLSQ